MKTPGHFRQVAASTGANNAFRRDPIHHGLDATKPAKGADIVEDWEATLADVEVAGAKGILRDLASLRKQLDKDTPDADRVRALLHRLGTATKR